MCVNIDMIRVEDKILFTVTHEVAYCVAVAILSLEGCIAQTKDDFEEFNERHSTDKNRFPLNYETRELLPTVRNSPESIGYRVHSLKIKFANVHTMGCAPSDRCGDSFKILE